MRPELLRLASRLSAEGEPFVLATVVRREAPTSAQLGDAALITADGRFHGWLGGACTKDLIIAEAGAVLRRGAPRLVVLTAGAEFDRRNGVRVLPMTCHSGGSVEVYLDPQMPEQRLIVFGDSDVAQSLVRLAPEVGFRVERRDVGSSTGDEQGSGGSGKPSPAPVAGAPYVVIATYGEYDESSLRGALDLDPAYVALVSGRRRFDAMRDDLVAAGLAPAFLDRVSSPAGLDIGARTPAEIALSILAEMVQVRRSDSGRPEAPMTAPEAEVTSEAAYVDPVCGMTVTDASAPSAEHDGTHVKFCCDACRTRFLAAPDAFISQTAP